MCVFPRDSIRSNAIMNVRKNSSFEKKLKVISFSLCLPIIIVSISIKVIIEGPVQDKFVEEHNEKVIQEVNYVNQQVSTLEVLVSNVGTNILQRYNKNKVNLVTDVENISSISEDLLLIENSNSIVKNAEVFLCSSNPFVIVPGGTESIKNREMYQKLKTSNMEDFTWQQSEKYDSLFLVQDLSRATDKNGMFLVITLNNDKLDELLDISSSFNGVSAISVDNKLIDDQLTPQFKSVIKKDSFGNKMSVENISGEKYSVVSVNVDRMKQKWIFYSMVPINEIVNPIKKFVDILLIFSLLIFVISVIFSQFLAKIQYRPIYETMSNLFDSNDWENGNEFTYLSLKWAQNNENQSILKNELERSYGVVRRSVMTQLIEGYFGYLKEEELEKLLRSKGVNLCGGPYYLIKVQLTEKYNENSEKEISNLTSFALENIVEDILSECFPNSIIVENKDSGLVVFIESNRFDSLKKIVTLIFKETNRILKRYVTVVISNNEENLNRLPERARKLDEVIGLQKLMAKNQLLFEDDFAKRRDTVPYPLIVEKRIFYCIKNVQLDELRESIRQFIDHLTMKNESQDVVLKGVSHLYDNLEFMLIEIKIPKEKYPSKENLVNRLSNILTKDRICDFLYQEVFFPITLLWQDYSGNTTIKIVNEVSEYLQNHYSDPQLSLDFCAEKWGIDSSYLSRVFKKQKGLTFVDFLTEIRLNEAKYLLRNSNLLVNQIAEEVGYNGGYFNRIFKKRFDKTPGQYRDNEK